MKAAISSEKEESKSKFVSGIVGLEFKVASAISDLKSKLESKKHKPTYHESHLSRTSFSAPKNNWFHIINLWVFTILALSGILTGGQSFKRNHWLCNLYDYTTHSGPSKADKFEALKAAISS